MDVRRHAYSDGDTREYRVALPVSERVVHRRREEWEAEAGDRAEERQGGQCLERTCISFEVSNDVTEAYLTQRGGRTRRGCMSGCPGR